MLMLLKLTSTCLFLAASWNLLSVLFATHNLLPARRLSSYAILFALNMYVYPAFGTPFLASCERAIPFMLEFLPWIVTLEMVILSTLMVLSGIENPRDIPWKSFPFKYSPLFRAITRYNRSGFWHLQLLIFHPWDLLFSLAMFLQYFFIQSALAA